MLREFLKDILDLKTAALAEKDIHENTYTTRALSLVRPLLPDAVLVHSLHGVKDAIDALKLTEVVIHVEDPLEVSVKSRAVDKAHQRAKFVTGIPIGDEHPFNFGSWYDPQNFVIALQSKFVETADLASLIVLASNVKAEAVTISADDGFSQNVSASAGVVLRQERKSKHRVKLAPYRTFTEVEQPASEFIFRARGGSPEKLPELALFEADGGKWRVQAVENICRWLRTNTKDVPIIS